MKTKIIFSTFILWAICVNLFGQDKPKFNLDYVASAYTDTLTKKDVTVILGATPIKMKDFPPILSVKFSYIINDVGSETTIDLMKQKDNKVILSVYDKSIKDKDIDLYNLIKNKLTLNDDSEIMILVFTLHNLCDCKIDKLSIRYGLWQKNNQEIRNEKLFEFNIGQ